MLPLPTRSSHSCGLRDRLVILAIWIRIPVWYQELLLLSLATVVLRKPLSSRLSGGEVYSTNVTSTVNPVCIYVVLIGCPNKPSPNHNVGLPRVVKRFLARVYMVILWNCRHNSALLPQIAIAGGGSITLYVVFRVTPYFNGKKWCLLKLFEMLQSEMVALNLYGSQRRIMAGKAVVIRGL